MPSLNALRLFVLSCIWFTVFGDFVVDLEGAVMTYAYERTYSEIFDTDCGRETFDATRMAIQMLGGEFTSGDVINKACSLRGCVDTWNVLNALDHLVTDGTLRELTNRDEVMGQHRRYRLV